jgi:AcrR family transcriptional regulator
MQPRGNETRNKILTTSFQLFSQQGYDSTGVAQICETASISKGAFYHHFQSKHELFLALLEEWLTNIDAAFKNIQNQHLTSLEQIQTMSLELNSIFSQADQFPMFMEIWIQAMRDPSVSRKTLAPYYRYLSFFEAIFAQAKVAGNLDAQINSRLSSRLIMAFAMGMILQSAIEPQGEDWQKMTQFGVETILSGLHKELQ